MQANDQEPAALPGGEIGLAIAAYIRGLIAADYSARTLDASISDLDQFQSFLESHGIQDPHSWGRDGILCGPGRSQGLSSVGTRSPAVRASRGTHSKPIPPLRTEHRGAQTVGGAQLSSFL
jgi:hypothetical protein